MANTKPTGSVTINGSAKQGQTLTATNTLKDNDGLGTISYQWLANGIAIGTGTSYKLTEAEVGKAITVTAIYVDGKGTTESVTSKATVAVLNVNDVPTGNVTISGTPTQGQTLTAANTLADADGLGPVTYQWYAGGVAINGATGTSLTLAEAQVGKAITVTASYKDGHGTAEKVTSTGSVAVLNVNDAGSIVISGTAKQGQVLTATVSDPDGLPKTGITYQWWANGVKISGATAKTLTLAEAQVGQVIAVTSNYTDGHGTPEAVSSSATGAVANLNDAPKGVVTINGSALQGQILTTVNTLTDADGLGKIGYQWYAGGVAISGAMGSTLKLAEAQVDKAITVKAIYIDGHGTAEMVTSAATKAVVNVNDVPTGTVTINGWLTLGQTLTADTSALMDADGLGKIAYQWYASGTAISGATGGTLKLAAAQVGKTITVSASYKDGHGTAEKVTSVATAPVVENHLPTGAVTIEGTATEGLELAAVTGTLADDDGLGMLSYQWYAGNQAISGATSDTLKLAQAQVGKVITVKATYIDGHGTAEVITSTPTAVVTTINSTAGSARAAENTNLLLTASKNDAGAVSWSLGGADASLLDIAPDGKVTLKSGTLNYEVKTSYGFDVIATVAGNSLSKSVTVSVLDVAEISALNAATATDMAAVLTTSYAEQLGLDLTGYNTLGGRQSDVLADLVANRPSGGFLNEAAAELKFNALVELNQGFNDVLAAANAMDGSTPALQDQSFADLVAAAQTLLVEFDDARAAGISKVKDTSVGLIEAAATPAFSGLEALTAEQQDHFVELMVPQTFESLTQLAYSTYDAYLASAAWGL